MNDVTIRIVLESYGSIMCRHIKKPSTPQYAWSASMALPDELCIDALVGYGVHPWECKRDLLNEVQTVMEEVVEMIENENH